jgi:uncharacterized protein (TIGR03790 family)
LHRESADGVTRVKALVEAILAKASGAVALGMLLAALAGAGAVWGQGVVLASREASGVERAAPPAAASAGSGQAQGIGNIQIGIPRSNGRLRGTDIGLVINTRDPYSVAVGEYYAERRQLKVAQVLRVDLPVQGELPLAEFESLRAAIGRHFGPDIQALALAWSAPWAVGCNSITGALALGYDEGLCSNTCAPSKPSPYANTGSSQPFSDFGIRPSMLIAARSISQGKALIDRGVRSDGQLATRARPPVEADFLVTTDGARNVRSRLYPPSGVMRQAGVVLRTTNEIPWAGPHPVILVQTGLVYLSGMDKVNWAPGGIGDHLTSFGGRLLDQNGQSTVLEWIDAGATASHGTVSEPCNHLQKFPTSIWLLLHYLQGSTVIEAYWKSVLWPQQSLFVGEPLAAPFARH